MSEEYKRHTSKLIGRDFYVHKIKSGNYEGLALFNDYEVGLMKRDKELITLEFLNALFDAKETLGCSFGEFVLERRKQKPCVEKKSGKGVSPEIQSIIDSTKQMLMHSVLRTRGKHDASGHRDPRIKKDS